MKSPIAAVTVSRWTRGSPHEGNHRFSRTVRTWAEATALVVKHGKDAHTLDNGSTSLLVRPRWTNGLVLYETGYSIHQASTSVDVGAEILAEVTDTYSNKRLRSVRAAMARECLARCAFSDAEGRDSSADDARAFDAAKRALETCFPDHADVYVERIRGWMLSGGGIR